MRVTSSEVGWNACTPGVPPETAAGDADADAEGAGALDAAGCAIAALKGAMETPLYMKAAVPPAVGSATSVHTRVTVSRCHSGLGEAHVEATITKLPVTGCTRPWPKRSPTPSGVRDEYMNVHVALAAREKELTPKLQSNVNMLDAPFQMALPTLVEWSSPAVAEKLALPTNTLVMVAEVLLAPNETFVWEMREMPPVAPVTLVNSEAPSLMRVLHVEADDTTVERAAPGPVAFIHVRRLQLATLLPSRKKRGGVMTSSTKPANSVAPVALQQSMQPAAVLTLPLASMRATTRGLAAPRYDWGPRTVCTGAATHGSVRNLPEREGVRCSTTSLAVVCVK